MTLDCLVSNPLRKQMFHQDCIDLSSPIIIFIIERFFKFRYNSTSSLIADMFRPSGTPQYNPKFPKNIH